MGQFYDTIEPEIYDGLIAANNYMPEPEAVAAAVSQIASDGFKILDIGCGTGLMGKLLSQKYQIFGVDASHVFTEAAAATGFYESTEVMYLGNGSLPEKYL